MSLKKWDDISIAEERRVKKEKSAFENCTFQLDLVSLDFDDLSISCNNPVFWKDSNREPKDSVAIQNTNIWKLEKIVQFIHQNKLMHTKWNPKESRNLEPG